jgi:hypothetical protein
MRGITLSADKKSWNQRWTYNIQLRVCREIMMGDRAFSGELQDGCSRVPPAYGIRDL